MDIKKNLKKNKYLIILAVSVLLLVCYLVFYHIRLNMLKDYPEKYIKEKYPNAVIKSTDYRLDEERYEKVDKTPWYAIFPAQNRWGYKESDEWLANSVFGRIRGDVTDIYICYDPETGIRFTELFTVHGIIPKVSVEEIIYSD